MSDVVLASAADRRYGWHLLNLLGSLAANSPAVDRVVVFDLGLSPLQRRLVAGVRGVDLRTVPPFAPHWADGFTWKPWIWTHLNTRIVLYLDAGCTVVGSLDEVLDAVRRRGYFVVSQGRRLGDIVPRDYYALYGLPATAAEREYVAAGILGFATDSAFYRDVIEPTYADVLLGRNVGVSASEAARHSFSLAASRDVVLRDCAQFRHDQTILNLRLFTSMPEAEVADLDRFGGWRSPHDHPRQVIWNHRKRGDLRYLARVPYGIPTAVYGIPVGLVLSAREWLRAHRWLFRTSTYAGKARRLSESLRRR